MKVEKIWCLCVSGEKDFYLFFKEWLTNIFLRYCILTGEKHFDWVSFFGKVTLLHSIKDFNSDWKQYCKHTHTHSLQSAYAYYITQDITMQSRKSVITAPYLPGDSVVDRWVFEIVTSE